ncbi:Hypothetical predicted protein [Pelobates cultripes]|uniref:Uncharacterized protein n=1 Tax=Pelobates cultripes TaxID=61616 RepID=A0AAD1SL50_PELCU|nr:Hypothetical predicted protein [Pelobates cultripes]
MAAVFSQSKPRHTQSEALQLSPTEQAWWRLEKFIEALGPCGDTPAAHITSTRRRNS